jgi:hypothetical protein
MHYVDLYEQLIVCVKHSLEVSRATYNTGMRRDDVMRLLIGELELVLAQTEKLTDPIPKPGSLEWEIDMAKRTTNALDSQGKVRG